MGGRPAALSYSNTARRHGGHHVRPAIVGRIETGFYENGPATRRGSPRDSRRFSSALAALPSIVPGRAEDADARFGRLSAILCTARPDASAPFSLNVAVASSPTAAFPAAIRGAGGTASSACRSTQVGPAVEPAATLAARATHNGAAFKTLWPHVGAARADTMRCLGAADSRVAAGSPVRGPNTRIGECGWRRAKITVSVRIWA